MKKIEELATGATSSSDINTQVTNWRSELIKEARALRKFEQICLPVRIPDGVYSYKLPISSAVDFTDEEVTAENTIATFTDLTGSISSATLTPTYRRNAVRVSYEAIEENAVDVLSFARMQLAEWSATRVDQIIRAELEDPTAASLATAGVIYPGAVSDVSGMAATNTFDTDMLAKGVRGLRSNNFYNTKDQPYVLFIAPEQEEALLKNSQFVNASEYGTNEVVLNGEIGKYLGIKIISTSQCKGYSSSDTDGTDDTAWAVDGHTSYLVKSQRPAALAWAKEAVINVEDRVDYNEKRIFLGMKLDCELLQEGAMAIMKAAD